MIFYREGLVETEDFPSHINHVLRRKILRLYGNP
jgi:hypothetical protein